MVRRLSLLAFVLISSVFSGSAAQAGSVQKYELICPSGFEKHGSDKVYCEKKVTIKKWAQPDHTYAYKNCSNGHTIDADGHAQDECNQVKSGSDKNVSCKAGELLIVVSKANSPAGNGYDRCYERCKFGKFMRKVSKANDQSYHDVANRDVVNLNEWDIRCEDGKSTSSEYEKPMIDEVD